MWEYNDTNELYHYGVLGMKCGVRKSERLDRSVRKQEEKRKKIASSRGVASKSYRDASKNLYITKAKRDMTKAKVNKDSTAYTLAKYRLREGKLFKKEGTSGLFNSETRKVYGHSLSKNDLAAISINEARDYSGNYRVKRVVSTALKVVGPVAVAYGIKKFNDNAGELSRHLSPDAVRNVNKVINTINRGADFVNKFYGANNR